MIRILIGVSGSGKTYRIKTELIKVPTNTEIYACGLCVRLSNTVTC